MRSPRKYLLVFTGLALSAVVASLAAQGPGVPPLVQPAPTAPIQPTVMSITAPQADVYAGPAVNYYVTSRLRGGDRIVVLGQSTQYPDWLEILPPIGSFSWIDARYVKTVPGLDKIGIVDTGDPKGLVPISPGSTVVSAERNVASAQVARGTQLVLGDNQPTPGNGTSWYPIAPTATERRFIRADAVRGGAYASNGYGGYGGNPYTQTGYQNPAYPQNPAAAAAATGFVALSQQGDQAFSAGHKDRAYQLYTEALGQTNDPRWQQYLRSQIASISQSSQNPASNWSPPGAPTMPASLPGAAPPLSTPTVPVLGEKQWSSWGKLRSTNITDKSGQRMYLLESLDSATSPLYVVPTPGTILQDLVGQVICLYGTIGYRSDEYVRMTYMVAERVQSAPNPQPGLPPALR